jgi:hypothetical protein
VLARDVPLTGLAVAGWRRRNGWDEAFQRETHHKISASTAMTVLQRILAGSGIESEVCFIDA